MFCWMPHLSEIIHHFKLFYIHCNKLLIKHIIISYPDAGLGHCPEGQGPDIKHKFWKGQCPVVNLQYLKGQDPIS